MDKIQWIKELAQAEQAMEDTGMVDFSAGFDKDRVLEDETIEFLRDLKTSFIEASSAFNQLKGSAVGSIKIYGISKTKADFMLFRNGFKLIFAMRKPGEIVAQFNHIGSSFFQSSQQAEPPTSQTQEALFSAEVGPFGDLTWNYNSHPVKLGSLTRYYLTRFVRESAK